MIRFMISSKNIINEKIKSIKNDYKDLLNDENHIREKKIIDLISEKNNNKLNVNDKIKFLSYITDSESEDIDILSYNIWVKFGMIQTLNEYNFLPGIGLPSIF